MPRSIASVLILGAIILGVWAGMVVFMFLTATPGTPA